MFAALISDHNGGKVKPEYFQWQILSMEHSYFPNWEQENKVNLE